MIIIRGTTPTIQYTFSQIAPAEIAVAYMVIKQDGRVVVEKSLADATVNENGLLFELSQEDTLALARRDGQILLDWKTANGTRGRGKVYEFSVGEPAKNEVI